MYSWSDPSVVASCSSRLQFLPLSLGAGVWLNSRSSSVPPPWGGLARVREEGCRTEAVGGVGGQDEVSKQAACRKEGHQHVPVVPKSKIPGGHKCQKFNHYSLYGVGDGVEGSLHPSQSSSDLLFHWFLRLRSLVFYLLRSRRIKTPSLSSSSSSPLFILTCAVFRGVFKSCQIY